MKAKTAILSLSHAAVDLACAALVFGRLLTGEVWLNVILYNAFAFLMQLPMGIIADRLDRNLLFAAAGCALIALAYPIAALTALAPALFAPLAAIVAGIGNGAFHVGGGIEILNGSRGKAGALGVFVSPGAIGLYIGTFFAEKLWEKPWLVPAAMVVTGLALACISFKNSRFISQNAEFDTSLERGGIIPLAALFLVVVLRAFMGTTNAFSAGDALSALPAFAAGLVPVLCLALGKAAGGFVSDAIGAKRASAISLGLCAALLLIPGPAYLKLAALFLFNMTMPITLFASARLLKGAKGTAFGLLTAALFLGSVPAFLGLRPQLPAWLGAALAAFSLIMLLVGLEKEPK